MSQLPSTERRQFDLTQEQAINQEVLEGASFQTDIGQQKDVDTEKPLDLGLCGELESLKLAEGEPTVLTFDLETTGLIRGQEYPHITQIAAFSPRTGKDFNIYVLPKKPIDKKAQQLTGITVVGDKMYHQGNEVPSTDIHQALQRFFSWLKRFGNIILFAHNGKRFDFPILVSTINVVRMLDRFLKLDLGFVDTLELCREVFPDRTSYKQEDLVRDILGITYGAHDALEDVKALGSLTTLACDSLSSDDILGFSFSPNSVLQA